MLLVFTNQKNLKRNPLSLKGNNKLFAHVKGGIGFMKGSNETSTTTNGSTNSVETDFSGYQVEAFGGLTLAFGQLAGGFISLEMGYALMNKTTEYSSGDSERSQSGIAINSSVGIYF